MYILSRLKSYFIEDLDDRSVYAKNDGQQVPLTRANLISSEGKDGLNYLLLDVDNADVWPSSTPGHWHIAFRTPICDEPFKNLVEALYDSGVLPYGNYAQYLENKALYLRTPWVAKGDTRRMVREGLIGPVKTEFESIEHAKQVLLDAEAYIGVESKKTLFKGSPFWSKLLRRKS